MKRTIRWLKSREVLLTLAALVASILFGVYQAAQTHQALVSSQRAWIAVRVEGDFSSGGESRLVVLYRNTGREPALHLTKSIHFISSEQESTIQWGDVCAPARDQAEGELTVYPSDSIDYEAGANLVIPGSVFEVLNGEKTMYLAGCFLYETFGSIHESRYCFYWKEPMQKWPWRYCARGNSAT